MLSRSFSSELLFFLKLRMVVLNLLILFVISIFVVKISFAGALTQPLQSEMTLCSEGEDIYFNCSLKDGKIVSICAKGNVSPNRGYVRYKYGIENDIIEYPKKNLPPGDNFILSDVSEGAIHGLHLKFSVNKYIYVISSVWPAGLYVSRNNKIIFDKECKASRYKSFSNKIFDGINQAAPSRVDIH